MILARVVNRGTPFGSRPQDRAKIASDLAAFEPLLRAGADHEITTTAPVVEVVAALEQVAAGADDRADRFWQGICTDSSRAGRPAGDDVGHRRS